MRQREDALLDPRTGIADVVVPEGARGPSDPVRATPHDAAERRAGRSDAELVDGQGDPGELLRQLGGVRFPQRLQLSLRLPTQ